MRSVEWQINMVCAAAGAKARRLPSAVRKTALPGQKWQYRERTLQEVQNILTYTQAECKMITKRLSVYTDDLDSVF